MAINKIIYGGNTLIDLTTDTITPDKLLKGFKAHLPSGEVADGTCDFDMNTQEMNAAAAEILSGRKAGVKGNIVTGTMKNNGTYNKTITSKDQTITIPIGYHDGSGDVGIANTEQAKIIPENIREGVTILGVNGTMTGTEDANAQNVTITPSTEAQEITPDSSQGYNYLAMVTVNAIPYVETSNSAGGMTVTIA